MGLEGYIRVEDIFLRFVDRPDELRGGYYEPNLEKINSALEAGVYQQFLTSSIQRIQLSKAKLLGNQPVPERTENIEGSTALMDDATSVTDTSIEGSHQNGINSMTNEDQSGTSQSKGPHLSLSFIEAQRQWNKISNDMKAPNFDNY
ncbi:AGAMOUS-like 67 [Striga asiatica]|uniref:AGAMOUS-like 67 n=1 Tax=Striga asiatica TaxID=4170 RepID=A0A5A7QSL6_STRAF|nr:AGAMOUS-like 67 [Striga asiatica]